ncbi:Hypothetical predicted protein [Pelobates cultripes]|uniref:Uncharacterized protein n=1 Tax=Pelobates cultripes TaxID=61616 RepID=A0AAD1RZN2_PELCU|nr:Hypothetical predicted protein [Pelobates cultripes]
MQAELQRHCKDSAQLDSARYEEKVQSILSEFEKHFTDFTSIKPVGRYLCFPLGEGIDVDYMASKVAALFELDSSAVESEILTRKMTMRSNPAQHPARKEPSGTCCWNKNIPTSEDVP